MGKFNYKKDHLRREFIKSFAVLLLALVLLISAVLAWFSNGNESNIEAFLLLVETPSGDLDLGDDILLDRYIVLPAATKHDEVAADDLAKVIVVEKYTVYSNNLKTVNISVIPDDTSSDLHYYIDTDYDGETDTEISYATLIKSNTTPETTVYDKGVALTFLETDTNDDDKDYTYKREMSVVYWAYYNEADGGLVSKLKGSAVELSASVNFSAAGE